MVINELVSKLGFDVDAQSFAKALLAVDSLEKGLGLLADFTRKAFNAIPELQNATADYASAARRAAAETGTSVEAIQELHFAAQATGTSSEQLDGALMHLSRSAFAAAEGSDEAQKAFAHIGVTVRGADGKIRPTDELLAALAEKFAAMPNGIEKTALAQQAFGRSGAELLPFLNRGRDGLEDLRQEAHAYGMVLDSETIASAKEFKRANHELDASLEGLRLTIGGPLLKGAGDLAKGLGQLVRQNRLWLASLVIRPYNGFKDTLKYIAANLWLVKAALLAVGSYLVAAYLPGILAATASTVAWTVALTVAAVRAWAAGGAIAASGAMATLGWTALLLLLGLVAEDLYYFATDGDSLIGTFGAKWTALMDDITKPREADGWFVAASRRNLHAILDMQGAWNDFSAAWAVGWELVKTAGSLAVAYLSLKVQQLAALIRATVLSVTSGVKNAIPDLGVIAGLNRGGKALGDTIGTGAAAFSSGVQSLFGGGSSPTASAAASPARAGGHQVTAPVVVNQTINAAPGQDPVAIGVGASNQAADTFTPLLQETVAAL